MTKKKKNGLESNFIEIINPKMLNNVLEVIYTRPSIDLTDFNCSYLNKLLENISKEQKSIFLLGHFNFNIKEYLKEQKPIFLLGHFNFNLLNYN